MSFNLYLIFAGAFLFLGTISSWLAHRKKIFLKPFYDKSVDQIASQILLKDVLIGIFATAFILISTFYIYPKLFTHSGFQKARFCGDVFILTLLTSYLYFRNLNQIFFNRPPNLKLIVISYLMFLPWVGLAMVFCKLLLNLYSSSSIEPLTNIQSSKLSVESSIFYMTVITTMLITPISEEIIFRGFFQNYLTKISGSFLGLLITSLLFGLIHYKSGIGIYNINGMVHALIFALFVGYLYQKTNSLLSCIIFHMVQNSLGMILLIL